MHSNEPGASSSSFSCGPTTFTSTQQLLAHLSALSGARPLLIWAPSAQRRVSCPVLGSTSGGSAAAPLGYSSWRQLWSALPPVQPQQQQPAQPVAPLCASCQLSALASARQQSAAGSGRAANWANQQQQPNGLNSSASPLFWAPTSGEYNNKSSRSSLATCSDYFSSFDQSIMQSGGLLAQAQQPLEQTLVAAEPAGQQPPAPARPAGQWCWQRASQRRRLMQANRQQQSSNQNHLNHRQQQQQQPNCPVPQFLPPLELRRQSTITGFDHHKYQAPRSPSLCLPGGGGGAGLSLRQSGLTGATSGSSTSSSSQQQLTIPAPAGQQSSGGRLLLSPTHSTGGSSGGSPSPTSWQQTAQALAQQQQCLQSAASQQHHHHHYSGANAHFNGPPPARQRHQQFGRSRLESLESDRGSSPSWSASTCSLRSSIGGGGGGCNSLAAGSIYSLNMGASSAANQQQQHCRKPSTGSIGSASGLSANSLCTCHKLERLGGAGPAAKCANCSSQLLQQLREEMLGNAELKSMQLMQHQQAQGRLTRCVSQARNSLLLSSSSTPSNSVQPKQAQAELGATQVALANNNSAPLFARQPLQAQPPPPQFVAPQQQQAVYFFLCCCQRDRGSRRASDDSAAAAAAPAENEQARAMQPLQPQPHLLQPNEAGPLEPRRVSLVGRPAIVGSESSRSAQSSSARTSGGGAGAQQPQPQQQQVGEQREPASSEADQLGEPPESGSSGAPAGAQTAAPRRTNTTNTTAAAAEPVHPERQTAGEPRESWSARVGEAKKVSCLSGTWAPVARSLGWAPRAPESDRLLQRSRSRSGRSLCSV